MIEDFPNLAERRDECSLICNSKNGINNVIRVADAVIQSFSHGEKEPPPPLGEDWGEGNRTFAISF